MLKKDLKGSFTCIATSDAKYCKEDEKAFIEYAKQLASDNNTEIDTIIDGIIYFKGLTSVLRFPKMQRVRKGILKARSNDFTFTYEDHEGIEQTSYGSLPSSKDMLDNGFTLKTMQGYTITYILT